MILDDLNGAARYYHLHPDFREAFEFLSRGDLASLATGKIELQGERLFALINRDPGRGHEGAGSKPIASTSISSSWSTAARRSAGGRPPSAGN